MKIQLHDNNKHLAFAPLTLTRPVGNLRIGILTNDERWKLLLPEVEIFFDTEKYLEGKFPVSSNAIVVNACLIPNEELAMAVSNLAGNEQLMFEGGWIAKSGKGEVLVEYKGKEPILITERWHLYQKNGDVLKQDFEWLTSSRQTVQLSSSNTIIGDPNHIFLEEGAVVEGEDGETEGAAEGAPAGEEGAKEKPAAE